VEEVLNDMLIDIEICRMLTKKDRVSMCFDVVFICPMQVRPCHSKVGLPLNYLMNEWFAFAEHNWFHDHVLALYSLLGFSSSFPLPPLYSDDHPFFSLFKEKPCKCFSSG
jgi:hypothetical protein